MSMSKGILKRKHNENNQNNQNNQNLNRNRQKKLE